MLPQYYIILTNFSKTDEMKADVIITIRDHLCDRMVNETGKTFFNFETGEQIEKDPQALGDLR